MLKQANFFTKEFTFFLQAGVDYNPGLFFLCVRMRILLSILFIITVSIYVLPVKQFFKDASCSLVENMEDPKKESKKKEKEPELIVYYTRVIDKETAKLDVNFFYPAKIAHPVLSNDAPPPDQH